MRYFYIFSSHLSGMDVGYQYEGQTQTCCKTKYVSKVVPDFRHSFVFIFFIYIFYSFFISSKFRAACNQKLKRNQSQRPDYKKIRRTLHLNKNVPFLNILEKFYNYIYFILLEKLTSLFLKSPIYECQINYK